MNIHNPLPRQCNRTVLRRLAGTDLEPFQAYRTNPEVARYQGWEQMTDARALSFLEHSHIADFLVAGEWFQLAIADQQSNLLMGDIGVCIKSDQSSAEIGFTLSPEYQGQGLASESVRGMISLLFDHSPIESIIGITDERNQPSINLLTAVGMTMIERLETTFQNEPCVELTFSISREAIGAHHAM